MTSIPSSHLSAIPPGFPPRSAPPTYFKQIDALRAIAVVCVLLHHYLPSDWKLFHALALGPSAVRLFFVISGFLITGILLRERQRLAAAQADGEAKQALDSETLQDSDTIDDSETIQGSHSRQRPLGLGSVLKTFYGRRSLRIFPPYYALLLIAYCANTPGVRSQIGWHLTYTTNIFLGFQGDWSGFLAPMWSLAVEEQFYWVWPLLVLTLPRRWLKPGIVLAIGLAPLSRWLILKAGLSPIWMATSLVTNLDTLGMGALLALLNTEHSQRERRNNAEARRPRQYWFCNWGLWVGAPLFVIFRVAKWSQQGTDWTAALTYLALAGCLAWVVQGAVRGFGGWIGRVLDAKPLLFLGKLSYGIYLYHMVVIDLAFRVFQWPQPGSLLLRLPLYTSLTLVAAGMSWYGLEKPLLSLKQRLRYAPLLETAKIQVVPFQREFTLDCSADVQAEPGDASDAQAVAPTGEAPGDVVDLSGIPAEDNALLGAQEATVFKSIRSDSTPSDAAD